MNSINSDNIYITYKNTRPAEGYGSILQRELFAFILALDLNLPFVRVKNNFYPKHEPSHVSFNKANRDWNSLFKFMGPFSREIKIKNCLNLQEIYSSIGNEIFSVDFDISFTYFKKLPESKKKFYINLIRKKVAVKKSKNILALHLRNISKGDTLRNIYNSFPYQLFSYDYKIKNNNNKFYTSLYFNIVKNISHKNKIDKILIFSTGKLSDFSEIINYLNDIAPVEISLNNYSYEDFKKMISAEYLVMSHSSFSWLASILSNGKKFIRKGFRHELPYDVISMNDFIVKDFTLPIFLLSKVQYFIFRLKKCFQK
jgi:hypothetical protein